MYGEVHGRDRSERGWCVVYRPRNTSAVATTIGRALKAGYFEGTFTRRDKQRPFFYIADEHHRLVDSHPVSGEQSFLDRCRAYRAICVLATQSVASLRYALAQATGDGAQGSEAALEIMMANCGTKLFFRSTDTHTQDRLQKLLPTAPVQGRPHVAQVRPASTLRTGESYALLSDGGWQRRMIRIEPRRPLGEGPMKEAAAKTLQATPEPPSGNAGRGGRGRGAADRD